MSRGRWVLLGVLALALLAVPASAYVPLTLKFENGQRTIARWRTSAFPVRVTASTGLSPDLSRSGQIDAVNAAMSAWTSVATSAAALELAGEGEVQAGLLDGINALEFSDDESLDFSSAVATTFLFTEDDGTIREGDILVNNRRFEFNLDGGIIGLDLQTALTKEFGHLLGLDNSPMGVRAQGGPNAGVDETSAVMFPIARGPEEIAHELADDDRAGISALYPTGNGTGGISGRVTITGPEIGLFGAHVVVFDPIDEVLVGTLTLPDGSYVIEGLPPGRYVMRVQPLSESSGLQLNVFGGIFLSESSALSVSFRSTFLARPIDVVGGTTAGGINVEVQ